MRNIAILPAMALACLFPANADAASGSSQTRTTINQGVNITKNADLHFGNFAAGTTQSRFTINPDSDALTQTGGNSVSLGGTHSAASFSAYGTPLERVRMTVSQNQINLTRVGGTRNRFLNAAGTVEYRLGGRLTIGASQAGGAYVGTFDINIDYQ